MISLNGQPFQAPPGVTISDLLAAVDAPSRGVAVAIDSEVVPRGEWDSFVVPAEARVEVLTAVQGG